MKNLYGFITPLVLAGTLTFCPGWAQEYRFKNFRVEDGLPTDVVKEAVQDSYGFYWMATDDGLVKFDGISFTEFSAATGSPYCKSLLKVADNKILLVTDLDVIEVESRLDTPRFTALLKGARNPTDSTIWYPKSVFKSSDNAYWMGEPQSIARLKDGILTRYAFEVEDRTPVFIRSFSFFEYEKILYAASYQGNLYAFDPTTSSFVLKAKLPYGISQLLVHDNELWLPANDGLYKAALPAIDKLIKVIDTPEVSFVSVLSDSAMLASTYEGLIFHIDLNKNLHSYQLPYDFHNINTFYISYQQDVWLSTTNGLALLQPTLFKTTAPAENHEFIESVVTDREHNVYFCNQVSLYKRQKGVLKSIHTSSQGYFQSLAVDSNNLLWAANNNKLLLFKNDKLYKEWDYSSTGQFFHSVSVDSKGNLWACQGNNSSLICIDKEFKEQFFPVALPEGRITNVVKSSEEGVYVGANGVTSYLFYKAQKEDSFKNISAPVEFSITGDFNVIDIAVVGDTVWLASSEGLLIYHNKSIKHIALETRGGSKSVKSVQVYKNQNLLLGTTLGMVLYHIPTGEYWLYDENSGLASNVISQRGIYVDPTDKIWVCTSEGLSHTTQNLIDYKKTQAPLCVAAFVNGIAHLPGSTFALPYNGFISLTLSSVVFPQNQVVYEWRFANQKNWLRLIGNTLTIPNLKNSSNIEIRAKKINGYYWSDVSEIAISVDSPFWLTAQGLFIIISGALMVALISYRITASVLNRNRRYLEELVADRTLALTAANEELAERNTELDKFVYSASHDLSAPLKSIYGLTKVVELESKDNVVHDYMGMMQQSIRKLESFIKDIINFSRNARMPIQPEPVDFVAFCRAILDDHQFSDNYKRIRFEVTSTATEQLITDHTRLRIALNNLISNAIKFHLVDQRTDPYVIVQLSQHVDQFEMRVEDNGMGIPAEHHAKMFGMFYRATTRVQGSGLGLYILKESVEKMGGAVRFTSREGEGTTFIILLPLPKKVSV